MISFLHLCSRFHYSRDSLYNSLLTNFFTVTYKYFVWGDTFYIALVELYDIATIVCNFKGFLLIALFILSFNYCLITIFSIFNVILHTSSIPCKIFLLGSLKRDFEEFYHPLHLIKSS